MKEQRRQLKWEHFFSLLYFGVKSKTEEHSGFGWVYVCIVHACLCVCVTIRLWCKRTMTTTDQHQMLAAFKLSSNSRQKATRNAIDTENMLPITLQISLVRWNKCLYKHHPKMYLKCFRRCSVSLWMWENPLGECVHVFSFLVFYCVEFESYGCELVYIVLDLSLVAVLKWE